MHRPAISRCECATAMRTARVAALDLLLPAAAGERGEPAPAAAAGRTLPGVSVFRESPYGGHAGGEPQTHPASDADSGNRSSLSETELEPPGVRPRGLSVPVAGRLDRAAQPGLEHRYYLYSDEGRLPLFGRRHGLFQPFCAQLGTFQHDGDRLLPDRARGRFPLRPTRDLELRSGFAVYLGGFSGAAERAWHLDQHGWTRPRPGQRFHRAPMAQLEVRAHLSRRLRQWGGAHGGAGSLLPILQSSAPAPGARLPHAGRSVPAPVNKEKGITMMGGFAPQTPQDLALFSSRVDGFCFAVIRDCRTMEGLDRRIGQRRDATRAPTQARSGWRPSGRLLDSPPRHLRIGKILSKQWGPPQVLFLRYRSMLYTQTARFGSRSNGLT